MLISSLEMWFYFVVLPNISNVFGFMVIVILPIVGILCATFGTMMHYDKNSDDNAKLIGKKLLTLVKPLFVTFVFMLTTNIMIPSEKQIAAIILVPAIVNNEDIQNIGDKSLDLIIKNLDGWLQELTVEEAI